MSPSPREWLGAEASLLRLLVLSGELLRPSTGRQHESTTEGVGTCSSRKCTVKSYYFKTLY